MTEFEKILKIPLSSTRQGIYVDIDTLFDTRFAILEEFNQDLAIEVLLKGWNNRLFDSVSYLSKDQFQQLYALRNRDTLIRAARTSIIAPMRSWIDQADVSMIGTPFGGYCEVFVNFWPYKLTKDHANRMLLDIADDLGGVKIHGINIDPKYLTPVAVKQYFSAIFMYDWDKWLDFIADNNLHVNNLLPHVNLYAPRVIKGDVTDENRKLLEDKEFFSKMEHDFSPVFGLQLLDIDFFSTPVTREMAHEYFVKEAPPEESSA